MKISFPITIKNMMRRQGPALRKLISEQEAERIHRNQLLWTFFIGLSMGFAALLQYRYPSKLVHGLNDADVTAALTHPSVIKILSNPSRLPASE